jgi:hypothetical protein
VVKLAVFARLIYRLGLGQVTTVCRKFLHKPEQMRRFVSFNKSVKENISQEGKRTVKSTLFPAKYHEKHENLVTFPGSPLLWGRVGRSPNENVPISGIPKCRGHPGGHFIFFKKKNIVEPVFEK